VTRLMICPRCRGEGTVDVGGRRPLRLCPHCRGEAMYQGRPYAAARRCDGCHRVYNPPLRPTVREAAFCTFCRTKSTTRGLSYCRACNRSIHPLETGRPRLYCELCHPYRRIGRHSHRPTLPPGIAGASV
jgi:RecJ-like exonuclease